MLVPLQPLQALVATITELKTRAGTISVMARNLMIWEPREKVIKVPFKTNNFLNSTMMASFLPVIVSKKNKQAEKYSNYPL